MNREDIHKLRTYLVEDYHGQRLKEQIIDQKYYDGKFTVPGVAATTTKLQRLGTGARMINRPAAFITSNNPQAFRIPRTLGEVKSAQKVGELLNGWIWQLKHQNPRPFSQHPKTNMLRGEAWIKLIVNEDWTTDNQVGMPVWFPVPDPMTIFASPNEFDGIPKEVIVEYERSVADIQNVWPDFKPKDSRNKPVKWLEYWNKDIKYFEADGEPVLDFTDHYLGFVPFVHAYSGFGEESPDGRPDSLVIGRLRYSRDLIEEKVAIASDVATAIHRYVYPVLHCKVNTPGYVVSEEKLGSYTLQSLQINVIPAEFDIVAGPDMTLDPQVFQHLYTIDAELDKDMSPFFESGGVDLTSGRHTDLARANTLKPYESIVDASQMAWSTAFSLALRIIYNLPKRLPINIHGTEVTDGVTLRKETKVKKEDIGGYYDCEIKLKAADELEDDRRATLYAKYWIDGLVDRKTVLMEGLNMTEAEADEIVVMRMVEDITTNDPLWKAMVAGQYANEMGMMELFNQALARLGGQPGESTIPSSRESEIKTPVGRELLDTSAAEDGIRARQGAAL